MVAIINTISFVFLTSPRCLLINELFGKLEHCVRYKEHFCIHTITLPMLPIIRKKIPEFRMWIHRTKMNWIRKEPHYVLKCKYLITICFGFSGIINTLLKHHAAHVNIPNTRSLSHTMCVSLFCFVSFCVVGVFFFSVVRCAFSQLAFFLLLNFFFLLLPSHLFSPKRHTTEAQSAGEALNMHCMLRAYFFLLLLISSNNGNELNGKGFTCVKRQHEMEQTVQCIHDWWHKNDCQMPNSMAFGNAECEWVRTLRTNGICIYVRWSLFCISENVHLVNNIIWWSIGTGVCSSDYEMCSSISWLV